MIHCCLGEEHSPPKRLSVHSETEQRGASTISVVVVALLVPRREFCRDKQA